MHDAGYWMAGLILSQGGKGGQASERLVEASQGGQFLGLDEIQVLDFPDTHLKDQAAEMTQAIEAMLVKVKPDIVFTHSRHDLHQDHQAVYEATLRAARNQAITILCYESPSVTQEFDPVYFVPVDPYADVKVEAMREHWDQHNKSYMKPEVVRGKLIFRGSQAKVDLAEGFEVVRMISSF
jgi:LmbE family N-acetylglucosaminyl deacetylase